MTTILLISGLIFFMIVQHVVITNPNRSSEDFFRAWPLYRINSALFYVMAFAFIIVMCNIVFSDSSIRVGASELIKKKSFLTLLICTFFYAVIFLLIDNFLHEKIIGKAARIKGIWLLWFISSIIVTALIDEYIAEPNNNPSSDNDPSLVSALIITSLIYLTYAIWIYDVVRRQMIDGDGFEGSIVRTYALNPFISISPAQAIVIGPQASGKTELLTCCDHAYSERIKSKNSRITQEIEYANMIGNITIHKNENGKKKETHKQYITLVDTPGENIGDHCSLPSDMRTDVLVLIFKENVFSKGMFDAKDFTVDIKPDNINTLFNLPKEEGRLTKEVEKSRNYLYALYYGLNIDRNNIRKLNIGRNRFKINSFVLLINSWKEKDETKNHNNNFQQLAKIIGNNFCVDKEFCFTQHCNIRQTNAKIFLNLLEKIRNKK